MHTHDASIKWDNAEDINHPAIAAIGYLGTLLSRILVLVTESVVACLDEATK